MRRQSLLCRRSLNKKGSDIDMIRHITGSEGKLQSIGKQIWKTRNWYAFVLPGLFFYLIFRYVPLYYLQIAFKNFRITRPIEQAEWAGLKYFSEVFRSVSFLDALKNTLIINAMKLVICFPTPIILAVLLNELRSQRYKRTVQTILYLPHFISWVVISSILFNFTALQGGLFNTFREQMGMEPLMFLGEKSLFRWFLVLSDLWKESGYGAIIYLSALTAIDMQLYEAASIDGAGRLRQFWHISLAGIKPTIIVMLILRIGAMMNGNFDQVQSMLNNQVLSVGDVLDTFVYRLGVSQGRFSFAAAAGLFNSAVGAVLLITSDRLAKWLGERGLF
jgi:putative aldouronate transport system permease protein